MSHSCVPSASPRRFFYRNTRLRYANSGQCPSAFPGTTAKLPPSAPQKPRNPPPLGQAKPIKDRPASRGLVHCTVYSIRGDAIFLFFGILAPRLSKSFSITEISVFLRFPLNDLTRSSTAAGKCECYRECRKRESGPIYQTKSPRNPSPITLPLFGAFPPHSGFLSFDQSNEPPCFPDGSFFLRPDRRKIS